jgi:hypothetical protein
MIVHVSIPSTRPQEVAEFVAKIIDGEAIAFPPVPGAWVAVPRDGSGNTVEVYPLGTVARPGIGSPDPSLNIPGPGTKPWETQLHREPGQKMEGASHLALSTRKSREEILRLGEAMGFRTVPCERGGIFGVIEVWIENLYLIEVITEPELKRYLDFMARPEIVKKRFGTSG